MARIKNWDTLKSQNQFRLFIFNISSLSFQVVNRLPQEICYDISYRSTHIDENTGSFIQKGPENTGSFPIFFLPSPAFSPKKFPICSGKTHQRIKHQFFSTHVFSSDLGPQIVQDVVQNCTRQQWIPQGSDYSVGSLDQTWGGRGLHKRHGKSLNKPCK